MQVNLLDGSGYQNGQPWDQLRWIQQNHRAYWHEDPEAEPGFWMVTRYADVKAVDADYKLFSSWPTISLYDESLHDNQGHRTAVADTDTDTDGQPVAAGDKVTIFYGIANRDPEVFADPWRFDVRRSPNPHVTFGFGAHYCLGSPLARLELVTMFRALLRPMPDMEQADPVQWVHTGAATIPSVVGSRSVPVRSTPGRRSAPVGA